MQRFFIKFLLYILPTIPDKYQLFAFRAEQNCGPVNVPDPEHSQKRSLSLPTPALAERGDKDLRVQPLL